MGGKGVGREGGRKMGGEDNSILSLTMFRSITSLPYVSQVRVL